MKMVDSRATHNFMKKQIAKEFGLKLEVGMHTFKAVNSQVEKVVGMANGVTLEF